MGCGGVADMGGLIGTLRIDLADERGPMNQGHSNIMVSFLITILLGGDPAFGPPTARRDAWNRMGSAPLFSLGNVGRLAWAAGFAQAFLGSMAL